MQPLEIKLISETDWIPVIAIIIGSVLGSISLAAKTIRTIWIDYMTPYQTDLDRFNKTLDLIRNSAFQFFFDIGQTGYLDQGIVENSNVKAISGALTLLRDENDLPFFDKCLQCRERKFRDALSKMDEFLANTQQINGAQDIREKEKEFICISYDILITFRSYRNYGWKLFAKKIQKN